MINIKSDYRPDIDGLRAIAVISVLLHHLNSALLPGGFLGVDIFFVISGYLITSHIYKEISIGSFSLAKFYKRRINRILPALMVIVLASALVGFFILSPRDLLKFSKSAVSALMGFSNIFFWQEYGNYFSGKSGEAPLLHTWSLGVEEQFYFIWPLLLTLLFKLRQRYAIASLVVLTMIFVLVSEAGVRFAASASYYLLPTRFFELMFGGLLSFLIILIKPSSTRAASFSAFFGLGIIILSLAFIETTSPFPGLNAVWPCFGATLLIWAGSREHALFAILCSRPMVSIGLISYSLYLWHWPIIAYLNYLYIEIDFNVGVGVAFSSFVLAWATWKFIETPMRKSGARLSTKRVLFIRFSLPALCFGIFAALAVKAGGFPERFDPLAAELEKALDSRPELLRAGCHVPTALFSTPPDFDKCRIGYEKADLDGMIIGDSFANHFTGMIDVMAKEAKDSFVDYTMGSCPPLLNYDNGLGESYSLKCKMRNASIYSLLKAKRFKKVILAANWSETADLGVFLKNSIDQIELTGAQVIIILNNPKIENGSSCPVRAVMYGVDIECGVREADYPKYFSDIRNHYPNVKFLDPRLIICKDGYCKPTLEGELIYRDGSHLTDSGSRRLGTLMLASGVAL